MKSFTLVSDPNVPPGMLVVKQGERIIGAVCAGVVFGTADIDRFAAQVIAEMRAAPSPVAPPQ